MATNKKVVLIISLLIIILAGFGFSALIYNNISKTHLLFDAGSKGDCHCTLKIREIKQRFFKQFIDVCVGISYLF